MYACARAEEGSVERCSSCRDVCCAALPLPPPNNFFLRKGVVERWMKSLVSSSFPRPHVSLKCMLVHESIAPLVSWWPLFCTTLITAGSSVRNVVSTVSAVSCEPKVSPDPKDNSSSVYMRLFYYGFYKPTVTFESHKNINIYKSTIDRKDVPQAQCRVTSCDERAARGCWKN